MAHDPTLILVAEDEFLIRMQAVQALTDEGFAVAEAEHGDAALAFLTNHHRRVSLLFTDVHMPGVADGLCLARHTRRHWPWIAILVTSGKAEPRSAELPEGGRFLPKPYQIDTMLRHVRELTAR